MDLFVNELSLNGQFGATGPFVTALKELLSCRSLAEQYHHPFFCLRDLAQREALPGVSFQDAIRQTRDMNLIRLVMSWISKHGPFWEESRAHSPGDYFEHAGDIVTDCGLGEAAYRLANERPSATVSFGASSFCVNPLRVTWWRSDSVSHKLDLPNFWERGPLDVYLREHEAAPQSWPELIDRARARYAGLTFSETLLAPLAGEPFNTTIAERVLVLLGVLDRLTRCYNPDAILSAEGHQLLQDYFHGDRALFSDESDTNKRLFARQLTFRTAQGEELFCPYHGKISFRYYRVHHSWPVRIGEPVFIAYIGPKITKS